MTRAAALDFRFATSEGPRSDEGPGARAWWLLFALGLLGLALRAPDALTTPQFWAEDGKIFFVQQHNAGWVRLLMPYAGYLHTLPRLVAGFATVFPLALAPAVYAYSAWILAAAACATFLHRLLPWRLALGGFVGVFLMPTSGEVFGNLTNVQWLLQLALIALCFAPAPAGSRAMAVSRALAVFVLAMTGPFSLLLVAIGAGLALVAVPIAVLRDPWRRLLDHGGAWRFAALVVGATVQGAMLARNPAAAGGMHSLAAIWTALAEWTPAHLFDGFAMSGPLFVALCAAVVFAALRWNGGGAAGALLLLALVGLGALEIAAASAKANVVGPALGSGDRYFFLAKVALATCLFAPVARLGRVPAGVLCGVVAVAVAMPPRHLQRAPLPDLQWRAAIAPVEAGRAAVVPINPTPWTIVVKP